MPDSRIPDPDDVAIPPQRDIDYHSDLDLTRELLGKGGQTVVYEARVLESDFPERVAVRQLGDPGFTDTVTRDKQRIKIFLDQAERWQSLAQREQTDPEWNSPNHIVGVVDVGENLPWVALEYMDGRDLGDRLEDTNGLPIEEAVWIGERLCRGLEVAHKNGVAHLDLKPGNILFRETGDETWDVPKIADWGLAHGLLDETSDSLQILSTRYAAPEQFDREEFGRPGIATDIYQLGAVLYAMLTGGPPYTGSERSVMFDIVSGDPPPVPSQHREDILPELDAVVRTALEPHKSDRYGSVEMFKQALRAIRVNKRLPSVVEQRVATIEAQTSSVTDTEAADYQIESTGTDPVTRWPMYGFSPVRKGAPDGHAGPDEPVTKRWQFDTSGAVRSSPAVVDDTVYVGSNNRSLYAVDAATGRKQWQFDTSRSMKSSPAVVGNTVYVGSTDENLYAVDSATGEEQWQFETSGFVKSSPAVVDGTVYFATANYSSGIAQGTLYAVDAATGNERWQFDTDGPVKSSPVVASGTVYVGSGIPSDGGVGESLYAVDAITGTQQWQFTTGGSVESSPAVVDGTIFFGTKEYPHGGLYAVDATTCQQQWKALTDSVGSSPAVADGTVYVSSYNGLYAVDAATGLQQWQSSIDSVGSSPAVADGTVYIGCKDNSLYAVDAATGRKQWQFDTSGWVRSSPAVVGDTVYVGSDDESLYAVEEEK